MREKPGNLLKIKGKILDEISQKQSQNKVTKLSKKKPHKIDKKPCCQEYKIIHTKNHEKIKFSHLLLQHFLILNFLVSRKITLNCCNVF